jgi:hypothetical protein
MKLASILATSALVLAACGSTPDSPPQPATRQPDVARAMPVPAPIPGAPAAAPHGVPVAPPVAISVPPDALYVCVTSVAGAWQQDPIEYEPKVAALCRKHPEMGPCQYEREACRRRGGRVFAGNGAEITARTEAEYDRKVTRTRFRSN